MIALLLAVLAPTQDAPVPPQEAPKRMALPEGFRATLFAAEPDVVQPIAFTIDDRGRLWVVECTSYPKWLPAGAKGPDRVLIFEDVDGDGRHDSRKVFADGLANVSGIERGFGGVWLCATPNFLFIPDRDGDDRPDAEPEALLDGWSLKAKHNVFNGLKWGPDGWLYGMNGITDTSKVGKPGTPDDRRVPFNCGVWRFHPVRREFEVVAWGTTNPWGLDWDENGQMFITNCVIKHAWHVVPGAHYERMFGQDLNPNVYQLLPSTADHLHWVGQKWQEARGGARHTESGGGHAHAGAMVYLGDNWPDKYRNGLFTCNIHGTRVNHDSLDRQGSGYAIRHAPDFLQANDPWFRGLELRYGPDGGVYVTDWSDTGECHDYDKCDTAHGRIHKITFGEPKPAKVDLARRGNAELVNLQLHKNDWFVRHARRLLQEREPGAEARGLLSRMILQSDVTRSLRALWALYSIGGADEALLGGLLASPEEHLRAWAVKLGVDRRNPSEEFVRRLAALAAKEPSAFVRLHLASALQWMPVPARRPVAEALAVRGEDAADPYLPAMVWYGIEPAVAADPGFAKTVMEKSQLPLLRQLIARRLAAPR
jgi:putative membrane-bound dehydrogenase-like protein